jgi:hypothetical protein
LKTECSVAQGSLSPFKGGGSGRGVERILDEDVVL